MLQHHLKNRKYGFTFIETVLGVALFAMVSMSLFMTYQRVFLTVRAAQARILATTLANEQIEVARNLQYGQVGTLGGVPAGLLPPVQTLVRGNMIFIATTTVRNIDHIFDGTASGTPNDLSPADNKLIEIDIVCSTCANFRPMRISTYIAPKDLESASMNGSLFIRVMNAAGLPIQGANVHVYNSSVVPPISLNDVTSTSGMLQIIDAPPSVGSYQVTVSKAGYSIDKTHGTPTTTNPVLPHATIAIQTVTQATLSIDRIASVDIASVTPLCVVVPNTGIQMTGAKLIATSPDVPKYDGWFMTGGGGTASLAGVEWDNYTIIASSTTHDLAGVVPLSPVAILPGATQNMQLILIPKSGKSVLVTVKDSITGLPVPGADVTLDLSGVSTTMMTGRGFLRQTDWSGGSGQTDVSDITKYWSNDGNIDTTTVPGTARLVDTLGDFAPSGQLDSSAFDTGSPSNFYQFTFAPGNQPSETGADSARFQIATGNSTSTWTFLGPDGTGATYYTATATDIAAIHDGDRYIKYRMLFNTASTSFTPSVSDAMFTFTSVCTPPGQVLFQGLADGTYDLIVSKTGYVTLNDTVTVNGGTPWQEKQATIAP